MVACCGDCDVFVWVSLLRLILCLAGPHYSREGRVKLSDDDVREIRDFVAAHPWNSVQDNADTLKAFCYDVSKSWINYLAASDPERIRVRVYCQPFCVSCCFHLLPSKLFTSFRCVPLQCPH